MSSLRAFGYLGAIILMVSISLSWPSISLADEHVRKTLTAASSNNFPPVNLLNDEGRLTGFGRELSEAVVKAAGGEVRHINSPIWTKVLGWLESGEADFIHDTGYTPDRTSFLDFSEPILSMPEAIFVLKDRFDIQSIATLSNKRVACVNKHITHLYLMKIPEINCYVVKTPPEGLKALLSGKVDAFIYPRQIVLYHSRKQGVAGQIKIIGEPVRNLIWHMVVKKGNAEVLVFLNRGIARVKATGEYQQIYDKWFGEILFKGYSTQDVVRIVAVIVGILIAIVVGFTVWTRMLRHMVAQKTSEIRESEERYRTVVEGTNDLITIVDSQGKFEFVNHVAQNVFGVPAEDCVGMSAFDFISPEDRDRTMEEFKGWIENKETTVVFENRQVGPKGSVHDVLWNISLNYDDSGEITTVSSIGRDITERKLTEAQLRQSQRMEAMGQLTGGVAHDFNNLFAVVIGNAQLLEDQVGENSASKEYIEGIKTAVNRGASLTSRLLAFSRQTRLAPVAADVSDLIGGLHDLLRRTLGEDIELKIDSLPGLWPAMIDIHQFENALINLAVNARDAMPIGGTLTIATGNVNLDKSYVKQLEEVVAGEYVVVTVSDTGVGMSPDVLERVFEPFFTTKDVDKGSGLGLSMVYGFVKQSRGHITIGSEVDHGTTVKLYMRRAQQSSVKIDAGNNNVEFPSGSERILVVEDDPNVRKIPAAILRNQGYDVVEAGDGAEAISHLKSGKPFNLLFTDVVLRGGTNGVEVAEMAKKIQSHIKVLYTSGYAESAVVHHGKLLPGVNLIKKPYHRAELLEKVQAMLNSTDD